MLNATKVNFDNNIMNLNIDGKDYSFEVSKISEKLLNASDSERKHFKISPSGYGIHWPSIDEDLSVEALLKLSK